MKDRKIQRKVIKGLLKQGYQPDRAVIEDIRKTIDMESMDKYYPYYILGLVCDYGCYIGMQGSLIKIPLNYTRRK